MPALLDHREHAHRRRMARCARGNRRAGERRAVGEQRRALLVDRDDDVQQPRTESAASCRPCSRSAWFAFGGAGRVLDSVRLGRRLDRFETVRGVAPPGIGVPGAAETSLGPAHKSVTTDTPAISAARLIARSPQPTAPAPADNLSKLFGFSSSNSVHSHAFVTRFGTSAAAFKRSGITGTLQDGIEA